MKRIKLNITMLALLMVSIVLGFSSCKDKDVVLTSIALDQTSATIALNGTTQLLAVFTPTDATYKDLKWESSNTAIATVADGLVTGVASGTTTITATSIVDATIKATCDIIVTRTAGTIVTVSGDITANTTWTANTLYKLNGFVYVKNNATLTIEAGTLITGVIDSKGALIIERGSKLIAQGTATKPIVFTSDKAVGQRAAGDWGGIVLCGKAKTNKADNGAGVGIAEGGIGSNYGGTDDNDNSGTLQYVRIEFPGISLTAAANSEINGLTLYSVGKSTIIDHIQVSYSGDDSYEWFGGNVNCKYIVAYSGVDDDFDTDNGFSGTVQFGVSLRNADLSDIVSKSNSFESDNDANGTITEPFTNPVFSNISSYGPLASVATLPATNYYQSALHLRRNTRTSVYNSVFIGWPSGLYLDGEKGSSPTHAENDLLQIEKTILAGITSNYKVSTAATQNDPMTAAELTTYYTSANRGNATASLTDALGSSLINITNPSFLPASGSILLSGGSFTNTRLSGNAFLDKTPTYRGAFGTTNWTTGWCNFNPKNTIY